MVKLNYNLKNINEGIEEYFGSDLKELQFISESKAQQYEWKYIFTLQEAERNTC